METSKIQITRKEAIARLSEIFGAKKWVEGEDRPEPSFYLEEEEDQAEFFINKNANSRDEVINGLASYFQDKEFSDGAVCQVTPITALYTVFVIAGMNNE